MLNSSESINGPGETVKPPSKKRRRTGTGIEPLPKLYDQTLTQINFVSSFEAFDGGADKENESATGQKRFKRGDSMAGLDKRSQEQQSGKNLSLAPPIMRSPATPRKSKWEIPSSQSPSTPFSVSSHRSESLTSHNVEDLPLKESSIEQVRKRSQQALHSPQTLPRLKVEDTYREESSPSYTQSSPVPPRVFTSPKTVRFADEPVTQVRDRTETPGITVDLSPVVRILKREIEDSEAESDSELDTQYDELGIDTQLALEAAVLLPELGHTTDSLVDTTHAANIPVFAPRDHQLNSNPRPPFCQVHTSTMQGEPTQDYTQHDSQRLSTQQLDIMAPRTDVSDIFISIHSGNVEKLVAMVKNHEFRTYTLPSSVARIWLYETKPSSKIRYMASIGTVKEPGEIKDEQGLGNMDFNAGKGLSRYAYEISQMYELANPVSLKTMRRNRWLESAPQKYAWVRPAVLDHLMANLMYPIFGKETALSASQDLRSDSQQADAQLQSTIEQFSDQRGSSERSPKRTQTVKVESDYYWERNVPSTQQGTYRHAISAQTLPRSSQATTVDLKQSPNRPTYSHGVPLQMPSPTEQRDTEETSVIDESPTRLMSSSSIISGETGGWLDMPIPFSLGSSQLLSRTQMLPGSLLNDSMPLPPGDPIIEDSEADDEL